MSDIDQWDTIIDSYSSSRGLSSAQMGRKVAVIDKACEASQHSVMVRRKNDNRLC
jgi:hypothetical protein